MSEVPKTLKIGPFTLHLYGLIIAFSIIIAIWISKKRAHLYKISPALFDDPISVIPLILILIGARIYHVLDYWDFYFKNPASIVKISSGGLGIWGGLIGFFIGLYIVAIVRKINFLSLLDLISPSLLIAQAIGRIGNYVNQEGFGPPTNLPWAVYIDPQNRPLQFISSTHFHPTFFYEATLDVLFFVMLIYLSKPFNKPGQTFALYLILYSIGRFFVEFWRIDTAQVGTIKVAQALSALAFVSGILLLTKFGPNKN